MVASIAGVGSVNDGTDSTCDIPGCDGDHSLVAGPEWGDLAGTILHCIKVDEQTWDWITAEGAS